MAAKNGIKHGRVYGLPKKSTGHAQLDPIRILITKGVADAKENVTLQPLVCDIKGSLRKDAHNCVIARALKRTMHVKAVSVGRSLAYVVDNDGTAIRFTLPAASRRLVEEFDQRGKSSTAPIQLNAPTSSWQIGTHKQLLDSRIGTTRDRKPNKKKKRDVKLDVRIVRSH